MELAALGFCAVLAGVAGYIVQCEARHLYEHRLKSRRYRLQRKMRFAIGRNPRRRRAR